MATNIDQVDTTQPLLNVNMINVNKLTSTITMTWSLQVHALLDGYDLAGYVDGSIPAPDQTITVDNLGESGVHKVEASESSYIHWSHQHLISIHTIAFHQHQDVS